MTVILPSVPPQMPGTTAVTPENPSRIRQSAEALESAFLSEMLKNAGVFKASESFGGGEGEAQFTSFLADAHARAMVARGGIGLADHIERTLIARQGGGA